MSSDATLTHLLQPSSLAIVGASERPGSLGSEVALNLLRTGYPNSIYPINPKYEAIHGLRCYPRLEAVPGPVQCLIVCIPAPYVNDVLRDAAKQGVRSAIVYSSGFAESGAEGQARQQALQALAAETGLAVCGPNCLGVVHFTQPFVGFSAPMTMDLTPGRVAAVCQSGSVAIGLLNSGRGLQYSAIVSSGNEAVVTVEDYLAHFVRDEDTDVILAFVEGFRNVERLRDVAAEARRRQKPIIVLKVGRSAAGRRSALAHTGALAGADAVQDAFFRQTGIIRVHSLDEMLETAALFVSAPPPKGERIGVLAISGGEAGMVADLAADVGLEFAELTAETSTAMGELLPAFNTVTNPLDVGFLPPDLYGRCLERLGQDENVDLVAVAQDAQAGLGEEQVRLYERFAERIVDVSQRLSKPVVLFSNIAGGLHPVMSAALAKGKVPALQGTTPSLRAVRHFLDFYGKRPPQVVPGGPAPGAGVRGLLQAPVLSEHDSKQLLAAYGIPVTAERLATSLDAARRAAQQIGYPVVLKVSSPDIQHKTDLGLVRLGIGDEQALDEAYDALMRGARQQAAGAHVQGVLVQEMLNLEGALELIVGVSQDPQFGPVVLFGLGGIFVEVLKDVALRVPPLAEDDAWAMLSEIRAAEMLQGVRGRPPLDRQAIVDVLLKLSAMALQLGNAIGEIDINPLVVFPEGKGAVAADALVVTRAGAAQAVER